METVALASDGAGTDAGRDRGNAPRGEKVASWAALSAAGGEKSVSRA